MVVYLLIALFVFGLLFFLFLKPYILHLDNLILFTGGPGSGKSFFSVRQAIICLRRVRAKVFFLNLKERLKFWKKHKDIIEKPLMFSTIPVKLGFNEWSCPLKVEHIMLQEKLPLYSVTFIDEINLVVSQMDYNLKGEKALNEFVTLYRHYTRSYLVANTQNLSKVHWVFRYCFNESLNLSEFRKPILGLPLLAWVKVRKVTIGDDIKAVELDDAHEDKSNLFAFFPFYRTYDTYCFSERYKTGPPTNLEEYMCYKVNKFMTVDKKKEYTSLTAKE